MSKKKLNIPVCNVQNDLEYHTIVTADYVIPQNYVRHAKKIGDEDDVTIDYNADEKDIVRSGISFGFKNNYVFRSGSKGIPSF